MPSGRLAYQCVALEAAVCTLPEEEVSSDELEARLAPAYERLQLPAGRLELMTGIRRRRFWPQGMAPSEASIATGRLALQAAGISPRDVGVLVHGSVCRDHLEPATAARVHFELGLPAACQVYDVSNACLGLLNGVVQAANQIELGQADAALIVGSECGRSLVEHTIARLNEEASLSRDALKLAMASLTIGSASAALVLVRRDMSRTGNRLLGGVCRAFTAHHRLCFGGVDAANGRSGLLMQTEAELLLHAGVGAAAETFADFLAAVGWTAGQIDRTVCHQVGAAHRRALLEALRLDPARDLISFEDLGNTGAAALPATLARGIQQGQIRAGQRVALLGIGSGLNVIMLGVHWGSGWHQA
ncbi:MAG: 3-oxoacyl-ACP synthase III [Pirellulales bacterium]|nr:3-oxoacyl-ACP synthase III [Pirellulales bacterium]